MVVNIHQYWVYMMSNHNRSVVYVGVTNDLYRRYCEHRTEQIEGFTKRYHCHDLVYYEEYSSIEDAIAREKQLKGFSRPKKDALIRDMNPLCRNLAGILGWE